MKYIKRYEDVGKNTLDDVFRDCAPFIEELRKCEKPSLLYRGLESFPFREDDDIMLLRKRPNRVPIDTPRNIHNELNDMFESAFGWKVRNGAFAFLCPTENRFHDVETFYGDQTWLMFPKGSDYKYCWSPMVDDLYGHMGRMGDNFDYDGLMKKYTDSDFYKATFNREISFDCDYYIVDQKYTNDCLNKIKGII